MAVPCTAEFFCTVRSDQDILEARAFAEARRLPIHLLGGGSNVVLRGNLPGLTLHVGLKGREVVGSSVRIQAGEEWHETVLFSIKQQLFGLENLALIPGQVGAAPIQNIGAYGVELSEAVSRVSGIELGSGEPFEFDRDACEFGYRDSLFKRSAAERFLITSVQLDLSNLYEPRLEYAGIREALGESEITAENVCDAVINIRQSKLPDPAVVGNAGSFFKNPIVEESLYAKLKQELPTLNAYEEGARFKLSAAFLIDACELKGFQIGGARVSRQHALVLENASNASGADVLALAKEVQAQVEARFNIRLEVEPRILS
jgi:UDP-N-acetylmuramate dehydrogenase